MTKYVDLHIHTEYTKNNGITKINDLVKKAKEFEMNSIGIADSASMLGVPEFYVTCIDNNINPVIGCGFYFCESEKKENDEKYHLVLIAENNVGYKNLLKLMEFSLGEGFYKRPRIDFEILKKYKEGLIALSGGLGGLIDKKILSGNLEEGKSLALKFKNIFGEKYFFELQDNGLQKNREMIEVYKELSNELGISLIVSGGSFYLNREDAGDCNKIREINGNNSLKGDGYYFKSPEEIYLNFKGFERAIERTVLIAGDCEYKLDLHKLKGLVDGELEESKSIEGQFELII